MEACHIEKKWRRGQDSNLHILSDGGFQDRCTTIMRPLRVWLLEYTAWQCGSSKQSFFGMPLTKLFPPTLEHVRIVDKIHFVSKRIRERLRATQTAKCKQ